MDLPDYIKLLQWKGKQTFSSSSNEIFLGLYASTGPVLDSAFLASIICHSWSSFTLAISLLGGHNCIILQNEDGLKQDENKGFGKTKNL